MFKTLKVLLLSVILVLSFYSLPAAVEKSDIDSIVSYTKSVEKGKYNNFKVNKVISTLSGITKAEVVYLWSKENTADHDYFDCKWTIHLLRITHCLERDITTLEIFSKDYEDFVSRKSRGFTEWLLSDNNLDGKIDLAYRDYVIISCEDDDCINNRIIYSNYPKGFRNMDWYTPSEEEREKRYNKEIDYWVKTIWGTKE